MNRKDRTRSLVMLVTIVLSLAVQVIVAASQSGTPAPLADEESTPRVDLEVITHGFSQPTDIVPANDGSGRLFVTERRGYVRIVKNGQLLDEPFLDISDRVSTSGWEQGLLSIAFDPDYAQNGLFYITSSPTTDEWRLERYVVSENPDIADESSATTLLSIPHPGTAHYGGKLLFGPDGYLWITVGDGGGGYDPFQNAQDLGSLMGKLLRIDVHSSDPYGIPADNPFVGREDVRPEIWAYGLRNPWRFSFDRLTGDIYIADVGERTWEELNVEPASSSGGLNYGWPLMEGPDCTTLAPNCDPTNFALPVAQHGRADGCSITGGYVYRGDAASPLWGSYVYADYCSGNFWTADDVAGNWQFGITLRTPLNVSGFGEDGDGNLFAVDFSRGTLFRVVPAPQIVVPTILRSDPGAMLAGGVSCGLTIRGWNFSPDAQVFFGDRLHDPEFVNSTNVRIDLASDQMQRPGTIEIVIVNGDGQRSEPQTLQIADRGGSNGAVLDRWAHDDLPVQNQTVQRTWLWGDNALTCPMSEGYADAPDGQRFVQYFDKSRMEINDPTGDQATTWFVTNGLLATELITGRLQIGDDLFEERVPSESNVAGDQDDPTGPTYRSFNAVMSETPIPVGTLLTQTIDRDAEVGSDDAFASHGATAAYLDDVTNHTIASPFWAYMNASGVVYVDGQYVTEPIFENPFYATGRPVSEAYWASVKVDGSYHDVLMQCFERRCLTYQPDKPDGWKVEAGNVGQHYYRWRYGR